MNPQNQRINCLHIYTFFLVSLIAKEFGWFFSRLLYVIVVAGKKQQLKKETG